MHPITPLSTPTPLRAAITAATRTPEPELLPPLLAAATLEPHQAQAAQQLALRVAAGVRARPAPAGAPAWCKACCRNSR